MALKYDRSRCLYADLEFHVSKRLDVNCMLASMSESGDIFCITGRGVNWHRSFEYDFAGFCRAVHKAKGWITTNEESTFLHLTSICSGRDLFFLKAQELLVREDVDVVLVGASEDLPDFVPMERVMEVARQQGAFTFIGHPYKSPTSIRMVRGGAEEKRLEQLCSKVDFVQTYNQQVAMFGCEVNARAERLARRLGKVGLAASDYHLYRHPHGMLKNAGISFAKQLFDPRDERGAIESIRAIVSSRQFQPHHLNPRAILFDYLSIGFADFLYLMRFALD
jgi:hypothetical protein